MPRFESWWGKLKKVICCNKTDREIKCRGTTRESRYRGNLRVGMSRGIKEGENKEEVGIRGNLGVGNLGCRGV